MGLLTIFTGNQSNIHNFVYLFSAIALERLTQEYWKAFFRKNQRKNIYKIPQSFHIFGKVPTYTTRIIIGILITSLTSVIIILLSLLKYYGNYWIIPSIILSIIPAIGGVWKDAPIEGFEILKFPRSFIVMFLSAFIIHSYTDNLAILILGSAGLERLIVEFYKTFIILSTPGKFFPTILNKQWYTNRTVFVASYFLSITLIIALWQ
ncbi:TPA: hypothetical protein DD448_04310 [Candidatus Collierbacteria bacterium]|nr:hypothetical protein [Candidatus Collierbacteria bacterium]